jgi:hypothetical protein
MSSETKSDNESIDSKVESWSDDINLLCFNILDNTKTLMNIHKNKYLNLKYYLSFFKLPLIIISSANSVFSVGLTLFIDQQKVSVINCFLSLICGIITAIELYLGLQRQMEIELATYHQLNLLAIKISHQMKSDPKNRTVEGHLFLNDIISEYKNIFESSLVNDLEIDNKLFKYDAEGPKVVVNKLFEPASPRLRMLKSLGNVNANL